MIERIEIAMACYNAHALATATQCGEPPSWVDLPELTRRAWLDVAERVEEVFEGYEYVEPYPDSYPDYEPCSCRDSDE